MKPVKEMHPEELCTELGLPLTAYRDAGTVTYLLQALVSLRRDVDRLRATDPPVLKVISRAAGAATIGTPGGITYLEDDGA